MSSLERTSILPLPSRRSNAFPSGASRASLTSTSCRKMRSKGPIENPVILANAVIVALLSDEVEPASGTLGVLGSVFGVEETALQDQPAVNDGVAEKALAQDRNRAAAVEMLEGRKAAGFTNQPEF